MSDSKPNPDEVFASALQQLDDAEAAKLRASTAVSDGQKSLDKLFDYTKFHIGLYLTLTASYVAIASVRGTNSGLLLRLHPTWFWVAVVCFMAAGLAGGVIASSITQTNARSTESFLCEIIGPWNTRLLRARTWTWIEHTAFWAGLVSALLSVRTA
jgi:hypothetical protein